MSTFDSVMAQISTAFKEENPANIGTTIQEILKRCHTPEDYLCAAEWFEAQAVGARMFCNSDAAELYEDAEREARAYLRACVH